MLRFGLSAVVTDTKALVEEQEGIYVAIAVALCCVVLMLTMDSFLLPLIFLCCIGVSILWNMGSNYLMGEISYITKAVAAVLQLAVTLDYSIFLWLATKSRKGLCSDRDKADDRGDQATFSSIVGSSLTTVAGLRCHLLHRLYARTRSRHRHEQRRYSRRAGHRDAAPVRHPHDGYADYQDFA